MAELTANLFRNLFDGCWSGKITKNGKIQWTSQEVRDGKTILYGFRHECKQETDDRTDHILMCEIINHNKFKYNSHRFISKPCSNSWEYSCFLNYSGRYSSL